MLTGHPAPVGAPSAPGGTSTWRSYHRVAKNGKTVPLKITVESLVSQLPFCQQTGFVVWDQPTKVASSSAGVLVK